MRYALSHPNVEHVTAIGRKNLNVLHSKLTEVLHLDFSDCSALAETLSGQDAVIFCLGTYTGAVSDEELRKITLDYTVEFARVLYVSSPKATFTFLSGNGADRTGRSRLAFARYKGRAAVTIEVIPNREEFFAIGNAVIDRQSLPPRGPPRWMSRINAHRVGNRLIQADQRDRRYNTPSCISPNSR
jgi:hypothetical protein